jgi:hypothetical protein
MRTEDRKIWRRRSRTNDAVVCSSRDLKKTDGKYNSEIVQQNRRSHPANISGIVARIAANGQVVRGDTAPRLQLDWLLGTAQPLGY